MHQTAAATASKVQLTALLYSVRRDVQSPHAIGAPLDAGLAGGEGPWIAGVEGAAGCATLTEVVLGAELCLCDGARA
jgi:hypothetical protein